MSISNIKDINSVFIKNVKNQINSIEPEGYIVRLKATNKKHFNFIHEEKNNPSFLNYLEASIKNTNDKIINSEKLQQQLVIDPESVSIDEVTIAAKEAEITLNLTKTILNKLITAYKDLINIR